VDEETAAAASNLLIAVGMVAIAAAAGGLLGLWLGILVAGVELVVAGFLVARTARPTVAVPAQGEVDADLLPEAAP
jgi:hypothetical protein